MTFNDYAELFQIWKSSSDLSLRKMDDSENGFRRFLDRNPRSNFAACKDNMIIASIMAGNDGRRGYIYHTFVLPQYRRQGIASRLVQAATLALREEGITRICLNALEKNKEGRLFWQKMGWEKQDFLGFYSKGITDSDNSRLAQNI